MLSPGPDGGPSAPSPPSVIVLAVLEGILLLMLIFLRQRIRIAIALLKEASKSGPVWEGGGAEDGGCRHGTAILGRWQGALEGKGRIMQWLTLPFDSVFLRLGLPIYKMGVIIVLTL